MNPSLPPSPTEELSRLGHRIEQARNRPRSDPLAEWRAEQELIKARKKKAKEASQPEPLSPQDIEARAKARKDKIEKLFQYWLVATLILGGAIQLVAVVVTVFFSVRFLYRLFT